VITVVIPAFNAVRYLAEAIDSIRAQGAFALEILVVDDGSTDGTAELASGLGADVRVIRQPNGGAAAARNTGIAAASGDLVGFLDADDLWPPGRLALLVGYLRERPGLSMVVGRIQIVRATGPDGHESALAPAGPPWHAPSFGAGLFRPEVFTQVGALDATLPAGEDLDWFIRAREQDVPTAVVEETTLWYRLHGENLTSGADPIRRRMLLALKRSLDRRRQGDGNGPRSLHAHQWLPTGPAREDR